MIYLFIFSAILVHISPIAADFVVKSTTLHGQVGKYFVLADEWKNEKTVNSALGLSSKAWPKSGLSLKVALLRDGSRTWCGDIIMWSVEKVVKGVHGRRDQSPNSGQWAVGD